MKKFSFNLDKVLEFKKQMEDNLRTEHAAAVKAVLQKEEEIEQMEELHHQYIAGLEQVRNEGCMIENLKIYENYLGGARERIHQEKLTLEGLEKQEETKREMVIEAKKERTSIDILKEKKLKEYNFLAQKEEERLIDEFVSNTMSCKRNPA